MSVNNVYLWPDRPAAFAEIHRVMKPNGRLFISVHEKWQHNGRTTLTTELRCAGFAGVEAWTWEPPGRGVGTALMLSCRRSPS
jgi:SAM-dependent methyltransferase